MADEFDPLKETHNKPVEELYATVQKGINNNDRNANGVDPSRSQLQSILKTGGYQPNMFARQESQEHTYQTLSFANSPPKAPVQSRNPFAQDVEVVPTRPAPAPPLAAYSSPQQASAVRPNMSATATASTPVQQTASSWQSTERDNNQNYDIGPPPDYYAEEYYEYQPTHKKKGFVATMDRLVQRFPVLGLFYRPPLSVSADGYGMPQSRAYVEEQAVSDQVPQLVDASQFSYQITAEDSSLNERYSNKLRTQIIALQRKEQTQPVDVCIHHDTYTIYVCDVGRSVIEIYNMYGKLQHVIDDASTIKFQPTSIAVALDGTIIVASHFNHRLRMYSPTDLHEQVEGAYATNAYDKYSFKQYKLGSPGQELHQFRHPAGVAIDFNDGYFYICDRGNYRIQVMRPEGMCERVIDLMVQDGTDFHVSPIQVAHQQNGEYLVCIVEKGDAIAFIPKTASGVTYIESMYIVDNNGLGLEGASGVALDSYDRIFIADTGHHRIVICTADGNYIGHFGKLGSGPGELNRPCGLDMTIDGTLIVADSGNKRLQLFGSVREQATEENREVQERKDDTKNLLIDTEKTVL